MGIHLSLYPHQQEAVNFLHKNNGGCLWMGMRTGKTRTSIAFMLEKSVAPVLIITPCSIMPVWKDELVECGVPESKITVVTGTKKKRLKLLESDTPIFIVNYEMLKGYKVLSRKWEGIIADESYRFANPGSQLSKYMNRTERYGYRVALSGAPAPESELNLVNQHIWATGNFMGYTDYMKYVMTYWRYMEFAYKWVPKRITHLDSVKEWVSKNSYQKSMKDTGLGGTKQYQMVELDQPKWVEDKLSELHSIEKYVNGEGKEVRMNGLSRATFEGLICAGVDPFTKKLENPFKINWIRDFLEDEPEPTLIISTLKLPLIELSKMVPNSALITGDVKLDDRKQINKDFQDGKIDYVFAQVIPVKMGLKFHRSSRIIYLTNSHSQDDRSQSEERGSDMTKSEPVQIIDVVVKDSVEKTIVKALRKKEKISSSYLEKYYDGKRSSR